MRRMELCPETLALAMLSMSTPDAQRAAGSFPLDGFPFQAPGVDGNGFPFNARNVLPMFVPVHLVAVLVLLVVLVLGG